MKLKKLIVENLYGSYDYNVDFNDDITFLYGENGCGKTTILNIINYIISGKIYKLLDVVFSSIRLSFNGECYIILIKNNKDIDITLKTKEELIKNTIVNQTLFYEQDGARSDIQVAIRYLKKYKILAKINDLFKSEYMALNRTFYLEDTIDVNVFESGEIYRKIEYAIPRENKNKPVSMFQINELIQSKYNEINVALKEIDEEFRKDILKSFSRIYDLPEANKLIIRMISNRDQYSRKINKIKVEYLKILKELGILESVKMEKYEKYFEELEEEIKNTNETFKKIGNTLQLTNLLLKYQELSRLDEIVNLANDTEKKKLIIRNPLDKFLDIINEFLSTYNDTKRIAILNNGQAYLAVEKNQKISLISIDKLSSGEKQIAIFFAHLILKMESNSDSIFIVDEPEMSLHPYWQKIFVDKLIEAKSNMQIIFATHSPEIIGGRRDKMVKLIRY